MTTKTKDWEEEFDRFIKDRINYIVTDPNDPRVGIFAREDTKSFIRSLLQSQKQEIRKMIEGMKSVYLIKNIGIECSCKKIFNKHIVPDEGNYLLKSAILEKIK